MSRIGKKPIEIPSGVEYVIEGSQVRFKGPKGELNYAIPPEIEIRKEEEQIIVVPRSSAGRLSKREKAMWGTTRQVLNNMVKGVTGGFEKKLEIEGVGYKAAKEGNQLVLSIGFSHPVKLAPPSTVDFTIDKNIITVFGIDKEKVGQFAATIRAIRKVEPYKGKGIRYQGEIFRRKLGKRAVSQTAKA